MEKVLRLENDLSTLKNVRGHELKILMFLFPPLDNFIGERQ